MKNKVLHRCLILLSTFLFVACAKEGGNCPTSTGQERYEEREIVSEFDTIYLYGNMNLHITQGPIYRVYLYAGINLLPGIITEFTGRKIRIEDVNSCEYLRDMNPKMDVFITLPNLRHLEFSGSGKIVSTNTLTSDSISVQCWSGGGSLMLDIESKESWFIEHTGAVDFTVRGVCPNTYIYQTGYAPFDFRDLKAERMHVVNRSSNHTWVNVSKKIVAEFWNNGNIYYTGQPDDIHVVKHGNGQLFQFNP